MADSKITQLSLSPYALDKDLMVVVTGHLEEGAFPRNTKMPLSYIRRYVVRLNLISSQQSGIATYYNSGLNVLTTWTTGIHAIPGNHVEVQFSADTPAANKYGGTGGTSHSGIISTTGLNAYSGAPYGNLIRVDYDVDQWPYSGVISQTGLNVIEGNLIDVQVDSTSEAATAMHDRNAGWLSTFNKNTHLGNKYHSGIISVTGVNARTENLIVKEYEDTWPYTGIYYNTGLNAKAGNHIEIMHRTDSDANFFYPNIMGGKYQSGVISVTGLNVSQTTGNLIVNHIDSTWPHRNILHTTGLNAYSGAPWGNNVRVDYGSQWPYSGIISQTGLNAIRGNLIDIVFDSDSDAATTMHSTTGPWNNAFNKSSHLGNKYHSGIISVTGLNVEDGGNRIDYTINSNWPYKHKINTTGLNVVAGNTFSNALNGIAYNIEPDDHHRYDLFSLNKIKHYSTNQTLTVSNASRVTKYFLDAGAFISYNNVKHCRPSDSLTVLAELGIRLNDDCVTITVPTAADLNSTNDQKTTELGSVTGTEVTIAGLTDTANEDTQLWDPWQLTIDNSNNPIILDVTLSGQSVTLLDAQPIRFTTPVDKVLGSSGGSAPLGGSTAFGTDEYIHESYRGTTHLMNTGVRHLGGNIPAGLTSAQITPAYDYTADPFTLGAHKTMTLKGFVSPAIVDSTFAIGGCVGIKYGLTNPKYIRQYRKHLGTATVDGDGFVSGEAVYRYHTASALPAEASWTINNTRYLKCQPVEQAPTISFTTQPTSLLSTDGTASFTGVAIVNDYTDPLYQWQVAQSGTSDFTDLAGKNSTTLNLTGLTYEDDDGDKYRLKVTAYDGLTTSNSSQATLTVAAPTLTITSHPEFQPIGDDGTATFVGAASSNIPGTTINYQWQVSGVSGGSYVNIAGATSATAVVTGLVSSDSGNLYRLTASAVGFSGVNSNPAALHYAQINITQQPNNITVNRGSGQFSITATLNDGPFYLHYIWQRSTNSGVSFFNTGDSGSGLNAVTLNSLTYSNHDQNLYRAKVQLGGYGSNVQTISSGGLLTVQEIDITAEPDADSINGKDILTPNANQNLIPTTGGNINLSIGAVARNSSATLHYQWQTGNIPTYYYQSPTTWTNITGEVSAILQVTNLTENSSYQFYRCLIDDEVIATGVHGTGLSIDSSGMVRQTSNTVKVTPSTFTTDTAVTITDNGTFATVERDGTSTLSERDFMTFHYPVSTGVGHAVSVDANVGQQAGINFGTGLAPLGPTGIARLLAVHPDNAVSNGSLGAGIIFDTGDIVNIQVTGNVNQYLARLNVPIP